MTAPSSSWWSCRTPSCCCSHARRGVQILEVRGPDMPCASGDAYLQSTTPFRARPTTPDLSRTTTRALALGSNFLHMAWNQPGGQNNVPGDGGRAREGPIWMSV